MRKISWFYFSALVAVSWAQTGDIVHVPCNDKTVEKLARLALTYVNEDRTVGYKFSLNRILNVHLHAQGPAGKVYYIDAEVLETKCHVKSPKPWKRCDIRPFMETQISGNCNTTVLYTTQGFTYLYSYDCVLVPDQPETLLQTCPDCPLLLPVDSEEAFWTARVTLHKYNTEGSQGSQFRLHSIARASRSTQVQGSFVEYTIQETECTLEQEDAGFCKPTADTNREVAGFCVGAIYGDKFGDRDVHVSCEKFHSQNTVMLKPDVNPAQHEKATQVKPDIAVPQDPKPSDLPHKSVAPDVPSTKPSGPIWPPVGPKHPDTKSPPYVQLSSGESSESNSDSSEELRSIIVRPPHGFRYKLPRWKRQATPSVRPEHIPDFLSIFPSTRSPFRSCPGAPRYTTV